MDVTRKTLRNEISPLFAFLYLAKAADQDPLKTNESMGISSESIIGFSSHPSLRTAQRPVGSFSF